MMRISVAEIGALAVIVAFTIVASQSTCAAQSAAWRAPAPTAPAPVPAAPAPATPAAPTTVEIKRYVVADHTVRLDFLSDINPDCTSVGYSTIYIVQQPQHGQIVVENSTGFTNFAATNARAECNKRRTDGVVVTYEPEPGYTGLDSASAEVVFPSGFLSKRHYAIEVK
jgi:hypothetical protein